MLYCTILSAIAEDSVFCWSSACCSNSSRCREPRYSASIWLAMLVFSRVTSLVQVLDLFLSRTTFGNFGPY